MEKLQKNKRIAISTIHFNAYSETFIKSQIDGLSVDLVLHGGWKPKLYNNIKIQSNLQEKINRIFRFFFKYDVFNYDKSLLKILKKNKIDVIIAQYGLCGVELMQFCNKYKFQLIVHFHGFDASVYEVLIENIEKYQKMFLEAKNIIVVSESMKKKLIEIGCPEKKLLLNTYGPNNIFFKNTPDYSSNTFFFVGRFVNKKAPYITLLAFKELLNDIPEARLKMAGDGELLEVCMQLAKSYKIDRFVNFLGPLSTKEIVHELQNSLAYVQHSVVALNGDSEGTPLAILEASASALPVISTNHAGIKDVIIQNKSGFLVDELDIFAMKNSMKQIYIDRKLAKEMGEAGRKNIFENFNLDLYLNNILKIVNN